MPPTPNDVAKRPALQCTNTAKDSPFAEIADAFREQFAIRDARIRALEIENRTLRSVLDLAFRGIVSSRAVGEYHE